MCPLAVVCWLLCPSVDAARLHVYAELNKPCVQRNSQPGHFRLLAAQAATRRREVAQAACNRQPRTLPGTARQGEYVGQIVLVAQGQPERRLSEPEYLQFLEVRSRSLVLIHARTHARVWLLMIGSTVGLHSALCTEFNAWNEAGHLMSAPQTVSSA